MSYEVTAEKRLGIMRRVALCTVSGLALTMSMNAAALAQEAEPAAADESRNDEGAAAGDVVTVTGIRISLESAQQIKREADTFVDAVTAEDIGALADRSVAEALQRVPGVNVSRFAQGADPDRFSVEGSGVIIRGLPFVRSELNGRDVFSATGGRELSFNDISPELLGRIEVFKNTTADMIDGGISGTVNLVTRKPLDTPGARLAGTVEGNYGDMAEEWSPGFSLLGSNTWETGAGTFGLQLGYARSELISRADASQVTDPCYRAATLDGPCFRANTVTSGGVGDPNFTADNFPPAGTVIVPKGAGVRTTEFLRDREAFSAVGQWESNDGRFLATLEYLRAESDETLEEFAILALVNDDALFPTEAPGTSWNIENGVFQSGILSQFGGAGIPTEMLRFNQESNAVTEDLSLDLEWRATDRLTFNAELQNIQSTRDANGIIQVMQTLSDIALDATGETPSVQFLPPSAGTGGANYFTDADESFYWFLLDNQVRNEGELDSVRIDGDYDLSGSRFLKGIRFGARWADRSRVTRDANYANWGNLSAPWLGSAQFSSDFPNASGVRSPFGDFQRGNVPLPVPGGAAIFFGSDDPIGDYLDGTTEQTANAISSAWENSFPFFWDRPNWGPFPTVWRPISARTGTVDGGPFLPGNISDVDEKTLAFYGRADFGHDDLFGNGWVLDGNIGLRYVETTIATGGEISFPGGPAPDPAVFCDPSTVPPGGTLPGYCSLSPERQAEFVAAFTGETIADDSDIEFDNWLPSLNATLEVREGMLFRLGVSKGISRPDLAAFRTGGALSDNTGDLQASGTLATGPLFQISTGNRLLTPIESTNFDLSFEWYFDDVGFVTFSLFRKELDGLITEGATIREFTSPSGVTVEAEVNGPANADSGILNGFELAYQDVYEFLPGPFANLGTQLTFTYVDADDLDQPEGGARRNPFADGLPLSGVSEYTANAVVFYEDDRHSARLAYNWRSEYTITPRDVIFPFNPIVGEATGQLDGSYFYTINDRFKVGVQGVNLLDEVTQTSQVIDFDHTQQTRSAFRNDRRFTLVGRFNF